MKQLKKLFSSTCVWLMLLSVIFASNAQSIYAATPYWLNTYKVYMGHTYYYGDAECVIEVLGQPGVTLIDNIDITFLQEDDNGNWIELERWDDLSVAGDDFFFVDHVENTPLGYTYRLTLSFDIHRNGTVEHIDDYFDRMY